MVKTREITEDLAINILVWFFVIIIFLTVKEIKKLNKIKKDVKKRKKKNKAEGIKTLLVSGLKLNNKNIKIARVKKFTTKAILWISRIYLTTFIMK